MLALVSTVSRSAVGHLQLVQGLEPRATICRSISTGAVSGFEVVGGREQEALELAVGVGRQPIAAGSAAAAFSCVERRVVLLGQLARVARP